MWGDLAASFQSGNGYVLVMMAALFLSLVVIFERLIMLQFVYHVNFSKFLANLKKMISAEDLSRAINFCKSVSNTSLPRIALKTLEARDTDPTTTKGALEEESLSFLPKLEARLSVLPALASLIMFVGVLGTLDGLASAFRSIDILDTAKKQAVLSQGIASSLNTTAMGLITCMIILVSQQLLRGLAFKLTDQVHHGITVLSNLLVPAETMAFAPMMAEPQQAYEVADTQQQQQAAPQEAPSEQPEEAPIDDIKDEEEII